MDVNLKRWLAGLIRYIQGCALRIILSETTLCTDSSADEENFRLATQTEIDGQSDKKLIQNVVTKNPWIRSQDL